MFVGYGLFLYFGTNRERNRNKMWGNPIGFVILLLHPISTQEKIARGLYIGIIGHTGIKEEQRQYLTRTLKKGTQI